MDLLKSLMHIASMTWYNSPWGLNVNLSTTENGRMSSTLVVCSIHVKRKYRIVHQAPALRKGENPKPRIQKPSGVKMKNAWLSSKSMLNWNVGEIYQLRSCSCPSPSNSRGRKNIAEG
ncbi:hypothetical protein HPP92_015882 [Vanilla planifolia]|uniref:Uncharacterized protein n=1 Tax=Vanilla planifolia TaxID=51239 RepID=A0A835QDS7_VANPL|nr:hypothetical protein HPP92_015882 [Vanilla planifolia]